MSADEALRTRRAMHAAVGDIDELHASVGERLAIRQPRGEWLVMRCPSAVRIFLKVGEGYVSRYVWRRGDTDATVDLLLAVQQRRGIEG